MTHETHETPEILSNEEEIHDTGLCDAKGQRILYETTIEALADPGRPGSPRAWRVWGVPVRNGHMMPGSRRCSPRHVFSVQAARTMAKTMFFKYLRYVERTEAQRHLKAVAAEEDLAKLGERL